MDCQVCSTHRSLSYRDWIERKASHALNATTRDPVISSMGTRKRVFFGLIVSSSFYGRGTNEVRSNQLFLMRPINRLATFKGTSPSTLPPKLTTSFTSRELT